jgi:hypothetical protein
MGQCRIPGLDGLFFRNGLEYIFSPSQNLYIVECPSEEPLPDFLEPERDIGDVEPVFRGSPFLIEQIVLTEELTCLLCNSLSGINELDGASKDFLKYWLEQGIVGTTKNEGINVVRDNRLEVFLGSEPGDLVVQPSLLGERYEKGAGLGEDFDLRIVFLDRLHIGVAGDGCGCADNPYSLVFRHRHGTPRAGINHHQERNGG